jgi:hypothetical protein
MIIAGTPGNATVLRFVDDDLTIPSSEVRIRWTHAAPWYPDPVDLIETGTGAVLASDLAYLGSVELDYAPDPMDVGVDLDRDGVADLVFQGFQRTAGEYFHVMFTNDIDGTPFLVGENEAGDTPVRDLVP